MQYLYMTLNHLKLLFLIKLLLLALPFLSIIILYFIKDPDMVLRKYKRFDNSYVILNEAYVGWQNYIQNRDSIQFDSFIMGNSCTMAYKTYEWEKHLSATCKAVRFFDNSESIGGVLQKLEVLESEKAKLNNILIIIDKKSLIDTLPQSSTVHLFQPKAAGISKIEFHMRFLQEFFYPNYLFPYLEYLITGKYSKRMKNIIRENAPLREPYTNNCINPREKEIADKGEEYWKEHKYEFARERAYAGIEEEPVINKAQIVILRKINCIAKKHSSNIILIIGPDYYQKRINQDDIQMMKSILGENSVFDFSGINKITEDYHNYYEPGHYRPVAGAIVMNDIYKSLKK